RPLPSIYRRPLCKVVEQLLDLGFGQGRFFLDHQYVVQPSRKLSHTLAVQRPHESYLHMPNCWHFGVRSAQSRKGVHDIQAGLSNADDAQACQWSRFEDLVQRMVAAE